MHACLGLSSQHPKDRHSGQIAGQILPVTRYILTWKQDQMFCIHQKIREHGVISEFMKKHSKKLTRNRDLKKSSFHQKTKMTQTFSLLEYMGRSLNLGTNLTQNRIDHFGLSMFRLLLLPHYQKFKNLMNKSKTFQWMAKIFNRYV